MLNEKPTTIAILGADTVVENAIALLLGSAGYSVRILSEPSVAGAGGQLDGVDLVLLAPALGEEDRGAFLKAVEAAPGAGDMRVLSLSPARKQDLEGRTGVVPWPIPLEGLGRAIESALAPVPPPAAGEA